MATNPQTRRALIDQIPTEEDRQAPAAQPQSGIHSSELGRQVYNTAIAVPGIGGVGKVVQTGGLVSRALNATAGTANKLATGTAALASLPAGAQSAPSTPSVPSSSAADTGTGTEQTPDTNTAAPQTEEPARQVAPGIYRVGNSYAGTGEAAVSLNNAPRGVPSAQNMAAADQLAANQQKESADRVARSSQPQVQPQSLMGHVTATHSGNDWTTRENLRRLKMDATSLIHQSAWAPKGSGQAAQHAYANAAAADLAAMSGGQTAADIEVMKQNAGLQREQLQQSGADRREGRRSLVEMARLGMDRETQAPQNRTRGLIASLQQQIATEPDTERRSSLVQRMRDIEGKGSDVDPYLVVPGGQQTNSDGQVYTAPSSVFNRRSGTYLQQPGAQAKAAPAAGTVMGGYRFKGGNPADQANWEAI